MITYSWGTFLSQLNPEQKPVSNSHTMNVNTPVPPLQYPSKYWSSKWSYKRLSHLVTPSPMNNTTQENIHQRIPPKLSFHPGNPSNQAKWTRTRDLIWFHPTRLSSLMSRLEHPNSFSEYLKDIYLNLIYVEKYLTPYQ